MSGFLVCTDSGCDLSIHVLQEHGIIPIRLKYEIDGQIFEDTMLPEDCHVFYEKMRGGAVPKTSQLNIFRINFGVTFIFLIFARSLFIKMTSKKFLDTIFY